MPSHPHQHALVYVYVHTCATERLQHPMLIHNSLLDGNLLLFSFYSQSHYYYESFETRWPKLAPVISCFWQVGRLLGRRRALVCGSGTKKLSS